MQIKLCYFNQRWNVYLYTTQQGDHGKWKEWLHNEHTQTKPRYDQKGNIEGEYRLRDYQHPEGFPIYSFGFMYNDANSKHRPEHGGEWSSNSEAINKEFGIDLIEIAFDQISVAVPFDWLKKLLGDQVIWKGREIIEIKGYSNKYHQWVELKSML